LLLPTQRKQGGFGAEAGLLRGIVREVGHNLEIYGNTQSTESISVSDEVCLAWPRFKPAA
jgi:hypothetical protein